MKKRVLFLMPSMFIGGAERSLLGLLDSFDYENYEVDLFLYRHEGEFLQYIPKQVHLLPEIRQYTTFDVPIKGLLFSNKILFGISRIVSKIAMKLHCLVSSEQQGVWMELQYISKYLQWLLPEIQGEYDAAISFLGVPDVLVNKVTAKVKMAWNHTDYSILNPNHERDKKIYSKVDYIVSVSELCRERFLEVYPELEEKAITIENVLSLNLLEIQSIEQVQDMKKKDEIVLLSIGRYSEAKNFDNVPAICKEIRKQGLNVKWFLIGYGGDEQLIEDRIREAGMTGIVIMLGKKSNPYPYIANCDLYIQPSRYEGKAVTVIEAQALHKPVVITKFPTSTSQLRDGTDGIIVPMDNRGCAEGIVRVLKNHELMERLAHSTYKIDYSNVDELKKLYEII